MGHYACEFIFKCRKIILDGKVVDELQAKGSPLACDIQHLGKIQRLVKPDHIVVNGNYTLRQAVVIFQRIAAPVGQRVSGASVLHEHYVKCIAGQGNE